MTHRNLFRRIAIAAGAAVVGLAGANADAHVVAGNYQDHVLPNTTRHTAPDEQDRTSDHYARAVDGNARVEAGNYQDYVLPRTTRRNADAAPGKARGHTVAHSVVMSDPADRR